MLLTKLTVGFLTIIIVYHLKMRSMSSDIVEDSRLSTVEIIQKYGYPVESHETVTEDGYILTLHRIPHGRNCSNSCTPGYPILVVHGMTCDSAFFFLIGINSPGFFLSDEGYDVWMINLRGNSYSLNHKNMSPSDTKFWDFSFHEMGIYDVPTSIDYIISRVNYHEVLYIGVSLGTTVFFITASERPEYGKKIKGAVMLGPATTLSHMMSPLIVLFPVSEILQLLSNGMPFTMFSDTAVYKKLINVFCNVTETQRLICQSFIFLVMGFNPEDFGEPAYTNFLYHSAESTSMKTIVHYFQIYKSGKFRQYDYGLQGNLKKYNESSPPEYKLQSITTPICLFAAENDIVATPKEILETLVPLPSVKSLYFIRNKYFIHTDFFLHKNLKKLMYPELSSRLKYLLSLGERTPNNG